jgi:hypothetical protein
VAATKQAADFSDLPQQNRPDVAHKLTFTNKTGATQKKLKKHPNESFSGPHFCGNVYLVTLGSRSSAGASKRLYSRHYSETKAATC